MVLLSAQELGKQFGDFILFENFTFTVDSADKIGLIGDNGAGKTTLFSMLRNPRFGESPTELGMIARSKELRVGYMEQHACSRLERTLYEEVEDVFEPLRAMEREMARVNEMLHVVSVSDLIARQHELTEQFEGLGGLYFRNRVRAALTGLGFDEAAFEQPVSTLSGGQKSKAAMARLLLSDTNLLLLDEPTNHLDIASVEWLEEFLRGYNGAMMVISHDRFFLDRVTNRTFEIAHKKLYQTGGNYSVHKALRDKNREVAEKHYKTAKREIQRREETIARFRQFNREKSIKQAESKQKALDKFIETVEIPDKEADAIRFDFSARTGSGNDVLMAERLAMGFGERQLFADVTFTVYRGERIFLIGPNGCGKTTLLKILNDRLMPRRGQVRLGARVKPGYYDQTQADLTPRNTVIEEVWSVYPELNETALRSALAAFLFKGKDVYKMIYELSGGERARVLLLKLMLRQDNLLLLDEPTNHLDIGSQEALEKALGGYDGTIFIVSHDRYFINRLATRVLRLTEDGVVSIPGNYDAYLEKYRETPVENAEKPEKENTYLQRKELASERRKLTTRLNRAEAAIAAAEAEIAALHQRLADPAVTADYEKVLELTAAMERRQRELDGLLEEWEILAAQKEEQ